MKALHLVLIAVLTCPSAFAMQGAGNAPSKKQAPAESAKPNANLAFVTEYVRELYAVENIRDSVNGGQSNGVTSDEMSNAIYFGTRMQIELRAEVKTLQEMRLAPPFDKLLQSIIGFDEHKIGLFQRLIDISSAFIGGPKPGVDYGKLAAEVPQLRAQLDDTDNALFEATPLIFETLVDSRGDSQNQISHLIITRAERAQLLSEIDANFGPKLDTKNRSYQVGAAVVLKAGLLKNLKSSDDPWE
ncbi:MAG: hypothetical protein ABR889_04770 [Acidobacteriaceae bacterium]